VANGAQGALAFVDDAEEVCRLCFAAAIPITRDDKHPNHIDSDDMIRLEELGWQDFSGRGFSLARRKKYSLAEGEAEATRRDQKRASKGQEARYILAGVLIARADAIHAISDDAGSQVFHVLETPTEAMPAHAEIRISHQFKKVDFLRFRQELRVVLGRLRPKSMLDNQE
jgi:hypothetical protein